jgi:hypothetical protein
MSPSLSCIEHRSPQFRDREAIELMMAWIEELAR